MESIHLPTRTFETRRPMTAEQQLERSVLEGKERDELHAIAQALSVKTNTRTKKADMIDGILRATGVSVDDQPSGGTESSNGAGSVTSHNGDTPTVSTTRDPEEPAGRRPGRRRPAVQSFSPTDDAEQSGTTVDLEDDFEAVSGADNGSEPTESNGSGGEPGGEGSRPGPSFGGGSQGGNPAPARGATRATATARATATTRTTATTRAATTRAATTRQSQQPGWRQ